MPWLSSRVACIMDYCCSTHCCTTIRPTSLAGALFKTTANSPECCDASHYRHRPSHGTHDASSSATANRLHCLPRLDESTAASQACSLEKMCSQSHHSIIFMYWGRMVALQDKSWPAATNSWRRHCIACFSSLRMTNIYFTLLLLYLFSV